MITYENALARHNTTALANGWPFTKLFEWAEVEYGTEQFWSDIKPGALIAWQRGEELSYVGIIDEIDTADPGEQGWIWVIPDPTFGELPEGQDTLPVQFSFREKLFMEVYRG